MPGLMGNGYGEKHDWERKGTRQAKEKDDRATLWVCKKCHVTFMHYYHFQPNIFEAIQGNGIKEECEPDEV